jgi:hypothetical protein
MWRILWLAEDLVTSFWRTTVLQETMYTCYTRHTRGELSKPHKDTTALQVLLHYSFIYLFVVGFESTFNSSIDDLHINEYRCDQWAVHDQRWTWKRSWPNLRYNPPYLSGRIEDHNEKPQSAKPIRGSNVDIRHPEYEQSMARNVRFVLLRKYLRNDVCEHKPVTHVNTRLWATRVNITCGWCKWKQACEWRKWT